MLRFVANFVFITYYTSEKGLSGEGDMALYVLRQKYPAAKKARGGIISVREGGN